MTRHREQKTGVEAIPGKEDRRAKSTAGTARKPADKSDSPCPPVPYQPLDKVEEASIESFPASDPPGYGTGHA